MIFPLWWWWNPSIWKGWFRKVENSCWERCWHSTANILWLECRFLLITSPNVAFSLANWNYSGCKCQFWSNQQNSKNYNVGINIKFTFWNNFPPNKRGIKCQSSCQAQTNRFTPGQSWFQIFGETRKRKLELPCYVTFRKNWVFSTSIIYCIVYYKADMYD